MKATTAVAVVDHGRSYLQRVLDGTEGERTRVTTDELFWEPVPGCWTVRRSRDGRFHGDWSPSPPRPTPFTTMAWRVAHIGTSLGAYAREGFGHGDFSFRTVDVGGDADAMVAFVMAAFDGWRDAVVEAGHLTDKQLDFVRGRQGHVDHHTSQVLVLRELFEGHEILDPDPFVDACLRGDLDRVHALAASRPSDGPDLVYRVARYGRWSLIPALLRLGFPVDTPAGETALHVAVSAGALEAVKVLVEAGADLTRRDPEHDSTPLGYAEYFSAFPTFGLDEVLAYLKALDTPQS